MLFKEPHEGNKPALGCACLLNHSGGALLRGSMSSRDKLPNSSWNQRAQRTEQICRRAGRTGEGRRGNERGKDGVRKKIETE